jgi:hypothetical protein
MQSFREVFAAALEQGLPPKATPFGDSLHTWDELLSRALPNDLAVAVNRVPRPAWAETLDVTLPCTDDDLRRAFRRAAFAAHPDRGGSSDAFKKLTAALDAAREAGGLAGPVPPPAVAVRYAQTMHRSAGSSSSSSA